MKKRGRRRPAEPNARLRPWPPSPPPWSWVERQARRVDEDMHAQVGRNIADIRGNWAEYAEPGFAVEVPLPSMIACPYRKARCARNLTERPNTGIRRWSSLITLDVWITG